MHVVTRSKTRRVCVRLCVYTYVEETLFNLMASALYESPIKTHVSVFKQHCYEVLSRNHQILKKIALKPYSTAGRTEKKKPKKFSVIYAMQILLHSIFGYLHTDHVCMYVCIKIVYVRYYKNIPTIRRCKT